MKRVIAVTAVGLAALTASVSADVRADEKTHVEFAGVLGRVVNFFGGKAAREGVTSSIAVKGNRKATLNDSTGQIIDLAEEKVYDLDLKRKSYKVTTFAELRRRMEEAQKKAEENASKEQPSEPRATEKNQNQKQMQIDVDVKNTGMKKAINGFDTRQVVVTITVHEKGKALEDSGGMVLTSDSWLAPKIPAMKEIVDFDRRYAEKLYGPVVAGASAEQMAAAMAMYPMMKDAIGRMNVEGTRLDGTPILTTMTMDAVKSAEQMSQEAKQHDDDEKVSPAGGVGGVLGGLARRAAKKKTQSEPQQRATFLTGTNEVLKVATEVSPEDLGIPAGFKETH